MNDKIRLVPIAGGGVNDYTHVITPSLKELDIRQRQFGYWLNDELGSSSLEPNTYSDFIFTELYSDDRYNCTDVALDRPNVSVYNPITLRFFGRLDTKELYDFGMITDTYSIPFMFFDGNDVGKPIQIYISTSPPPLVIRSHYRLLRFGQRIATFLRRWRDAFKINLNLNTIGG